MMIFAYPWRNGETSQASPRWVSRQVRSGGTLDDDRSLMATFRRTIGLNFDRFLSEPPIDSERHEVSTDQVATLQLYRTWPQRQAVG